jgi:hypothetical protein
MRLKIPMTSANETLIPLINRGYSALAAIGHRRTTPHLKQTRRPIGQAELPHAPLKEAAQAAKSHMTITPFIRTW